MGILKAYDLVEIMIDKFQGSIESLQDLDIFDSINIYIDGNFFLFTGYVESSMNEERLIGEAACQCVERLLDRISTVLSSRVNECKIYFDGERPEIKVIRRDRNNGKTTFSISEALKYFRFCLEQVNGLPFNVELVNLLYGESEHEMFQRRDARHPSLLLSDDSDLFHITFNYEKLHTRDIVILGNKKLNRFYRMDNDFHLYDDMPRLVFSSLMFLKGSDFTHPTFTPTMSSTFVRVWKDPPNWQCRAIKRDIIKRCERYRAKEVDIWNDLNSNKNVTINEKNEYFPPSRCSYRYIYKAVDVTAIIKDLLSMLISVNEQMTFRWNATSNKLNCSNNNYLNTVIWSVNYSLIGCNMQRYHQNEYNLSKNVNPLSFYVYMLFNLPLDECYGIITPVIFKSLFPYVMSRANNTFRDYKCECRIDKPRITMNREMFQCILKSYIEYGTSRRILDYENVEQLKRILNHQYSSSYDINWCLYSNERSIGYRSNTTNLTLPLLYERKPVNGTNGNVNRMLDILSLGEFADFVERHLTCKLFRHEREEAGSFFKRLTSSRHY